MKSVFEFEFKVDSETSYVAGQPEIPVDEVYVAGNDRMALITALLYDQRVGGIRLSPEDMDRLCKEWIDARRVCLFCHEPGMDVAIDEQPHFDNVITRWECEHCGGEMDI